MAPLVPPLYHTFPNHLLYCFSVHLTEMSDTLPAASLTCGPDEVNHGGTCESAYPAPVFMALACLLVLGHTPKQLGGRGVARQPGMQRQPPRCSS